MRRSRVSGVGAVSLLLAVLPAQKRSPAIGTVTAADGSAVAGASVTFAGSPLLPLTEAETDVVAVVADARGRFAGGLLPGRAYSVFAVTKPAADGTFCVSDVQEQVLAGAVLSLRLGASRPAQCVQLRGTEPWNSVAPLRLEVAPAMANVLRVPVVAGGPMPPLPPTGSVFIIDAHGDVLWVENRSTWSDTPWGDESAPELVVSLPPPHPLGVRVTDTAGTPLAGIDVAVSLFDTRSTYARMRFAMSDCWPQLSPARCWRTVGTSDATGMATLCLPARVQNHRLMTPVHLRAIAPGCAFGYSGLNAFPGPPYVNEAAIPVPADNVLPIKPTAAVRWSVREGNGPARARELTLFATCRIANSASLREAWRLHTDNDGAMAVPAPLAMARGLLLAATSAEGTGYFTPPPAGATTLDLGSRRLMLQVLDAGGGPASGLLVAVFPWNSDHSDMPFVPVALDRAGRGEVRLGHTDWTVFVTDGKGYASRSLRADAGDVHWELRLEAMLVVRVRVVDRTGTPVSGAMFNVTGGSLKGSGGDGGDARVLLFVFQQHLYAAIESLRSDRDGVLALPLIPCTTCELRARVTEDPRVVSRWRSSEMFPVVPGEQFDAVLR